MARDGRSGRGPASGTGRREKTREEATDATVERLWSRLRGVVERRVVDPQGRTLLTKSMLELVCETHEELELAEAALAAGDVKTYGASVSLATDSLRELEQIPTYLTAAMLEQDRESSAAGGRQRRRPDRDQRLRDAVNARVAAGEKKIAAIWAVADAEGLSPRWVERLYYRRKP